MYITISVRWWKTQLKGKKIRSANRVVALHDEEYGIDKTVPKQTGVFLNVVKNFIECINIQTITLHSQLLYRTISIY